MAPLINDAESARRYRGRPRRVDAAKAQELKAQGMAYAEIARMLGCSPQYVGQLLGRKGEGPGSPSWAARQPEEVRRMYAAGATQEQMAEHFDCSVGAIRRALAKTR